MNFTVKDLEKIQEKLQEDGRDYQLELHDGKLIVMSPSDIESSEIGIRFSWLLMNWVNPRRLGRVFDSSGGFVMPNTNLLSPDIAFVSAERLKRSQRSYGELVPDLVVEIKSKSDRLSSVQKKIQQYLEMKAKVGILIDPDRRVITIYRSEQEPIVLSNNDKLSIPELFPGWEILISEIWPPVFE
jgi:Uma2 family endonuclease